jgi:hypothetical protein
MRRGSFLIAVLVLVALGAATVLGLRTRFGNPWDLKLANVEINPRTNNSRLISLRLQNIGSRVAQIEPDCRFQAFVAGRWTEPHLVPQLSGRLAWLPADTNSVGMAFELPTSAESCKVRFSYRLGGSAYCRACLFLSRHGVSRAFPRLSRFVLSWFSRRPALRQTALEVTLPPAT